MDTEAFYGGDWIKKSRCWNESPSPDLFFNETRIDEAKKYCSYCPVASECIKLGNKLKARGVWGGQTYQVRRKRESQTHKVLQEFEARLRTLSQGVSDPNAA